MSMDHILISPSGECRVIVSPDDIKLSLIAGNASCLVLHREDIEKAIALMDAEKKRQERP